MLEVQFHQKVDDSLFRFAVIVSKHQGKWVFCKHKKRTTLECPGGHREANEEIEATARRELWEETGAVDYTLQEVCAYSVKSESQQSYGMLYYAEIFTLGDLPALEIEKIVLCDTMPDSWTYPLIQSKLVEKVQSAICCAD